MPVLEALAIVGVVGWLDSAASTQGCERIQLSRPAQYITFERSGIGKPVYNGESKDRVWLRLHNNTTCPIRILGGHIHFRSDKSADMNPDNGEESTVEYHLYDSRRSTEPRQWAGGDTHNVATLRPGFSVIFDVPGSHFRQGQGVAVPFAYSWDDNSLGHFALRHYVYLVPEDLPEKLRGRLKR